LGIDVTLASGYNSRSRVSRSEKSRPYWNRAIKQQVIALAVSNPLAAPIDRDAVVRAGSMVLAVWRSASELDGVGVLVIKGQPYLRTIIMDNQPLPPNSRVIECRGYAEACSLRSD
jgi:hypothetical protein